MKEVTAVSCPDPNCRKGGCSTPDDRRKDK